MEHRVQTTAPGIPPEALLRRDLQWSGLFLVFALLLVVVPGRVAAVVILDGDGTGNTSAPEDDPGFANIVERGVGSAVYLGNRWLITASHVGAGPVNIQGQDYTHDPASVHRIDNPSHLSPQTDLVLFQLDEAPPLPALHLGSQPVLLGSEVMMIGRGRNRLPEPTFWDVTRVAGDDNDIWKIVDQPPPVADYEGYQTAATKEVRWGKNVVTQTDLEVETAFSGDVLSFQTTFDDQFAVGSEAQAVVGDSGGAVFQKNGPLWELVGVMYSIQPEENQPGLANTAIFGNQTLIADLFQYGPQIRQIADFEPAPGDFDGDGQITIADIELLQKDVRGVSHVQHFDLNRDEVVDAADIEVLLIAAQSLMGDTNLDGEVAFVDFLILANHFGNQAGWGGGDFSGDGTVAFEDFLILSQRFGDQFETSSEPTQVAASIPEPSGLSLLLLSLFATAALARADLTR